MVDQFRVAKATRGAPSFDWEVLTPHDSSNFTRVYEYIYVGTGGDVVFVKDDDSTATIPMQSGGYFLSSNVKRINNTNTTAQDIVGFY